MGDDRHDLLRRLPSVDEAVRGLEGTAAGRWPRWALLRAVRELIDERRQKILDSGGGSGGFRCCLDVWRL